MKKYNQKSPLAHLLLTVLIGMLLFSVISLGEVIKIAPTDDCYVDFYNPDVPYPDDQTNGLRVRGGSSANWRQTFLKFPLVGIDTTNVDKVQLKLTVQKLLGGSTGRFQVYAVSDTTWDEETLTWNTKPDLLITDILDSQNDPITNVSVTDSPDTTLYYDITEYALAQLTAGAEYLAIALNDSAEHGGAEGTKIDARFYSKEMVNPLLDDPSSAEYSEELDAASVQPCLVVKTSVTKVLPTDDCYVDFYNPDVSYPDDQTNGLRVRGGSSSNWRQTFLKFPLTGIDVNDVGNVQFKITVQKLLGGSTGRFQVYAVSDTTWDEENLTWNTKPDLLVTDILDSQNDPITNVSVTDSPDTTLYYDITEYALAQLTAGAEYLAIALNDSAEHGGAEGTKIDARFYSKEMVNPLLDDPSSAEYSEVLDSNSVKPMLIFKSEPAPEMYTLTVNIVGSGSVIVNPDLLEYEVGTEVTLAPVPDLDYAFAAWTGAVATTDSVIIITMDDNKSAIAHFKSTLVNNYKVSVLPLADCYVQMDSPDTPYPDDQTNGIRVRSNSSSSYRQLFIKFPVSDIPTNEIEKVEIKLTVLKMQVSGTWAVYGISDTSWQEETLTWNTKPTLQESDVITSLIEPIPANTTGDPDIDVFFDVTDYVKAQISAGASVIAFAMNDTTALGSGVDARFYSKEMTNLLLDDPSSIEFSAELSAESVKPALIYKMQEPAPQYVLEVNVVGNGIVEKTPDFALYDEGTVVTLTAKPDSGYVFVTWVGDASGTDSVVVLTMDGNKVVTVYFVPYTDPDAEMKILPSDDCYAQKDTPDLPYPDDQVRGLRVRSGHPIWRMAYLKFPVDGIEPDEIGKVEIKLTVLQMPAVGTWQVYGINDTTWNEDSLTWNNRPGLQNWEILADQEKPIIGYNRSDHPDTTVYHDVTHYVLKQLNAGAKCVAFALNDALEHGNQEGTGIDARFYSKEMVNPLLDDPSSAEYNPLLDSASVKPFLKFTKGINPVLHHKLYVDKTGKGTVSMDPVGRYFENGSVVTLTATPDSLSEFEGWSGDVTSSEPLINVTMNSDKKIAGVFTEPEFAAKFCVNMRVQILRGAFDPAKDTVDVSGSFGHNGAKEIILLDDDADSIYCMELKYKKLSSNRKATFRFRINGTPEERGGSAKSGSDREVEVSSDTTFVFWYNDEEDVELGIVELLPTKYELQQNYPNPFNPSTTINFALRQQGFTSLVVYDMLGREVARLVNRDMKAGYHRVVFSDMNLSSGVYIYRLTSGDFISVKKMMLMK